MTFSATQITRSGAVHCKAEIKEVFPLLCPKREEEWIPGWECETIWSHSGYNEEGAIFRTSKPYGTELYWTTLRYDIKDGVVDFLITAPRLYMFRFTIKVHDDGDGSLSILFSQVFTAIAEEGNAFLQRYQNEDFGARLKSLETFMCNHLEGKKKQRIR